MRHSDGGEILEPGDPRVREIGIIHVSASDDRQSAITAIATQEKLSRTWIILDLPAQNRSFKTDIDFEGLHRMTDEIEASLFLLVPRKSKIANLARKEGFTFFYTMDELVDSEFPPLSGEAEEEPVDEAPEPVEAPVSSVDDDETDHTLFFPIVPLPTVIPSDPEEMVSTAPLQEPMPGDSLPADSQTAAPVPREEARAEEDENGEQPPISAPPIEPFVFTPPIQAEVFPSSSQQPEESEESSPPAGPRATTDEDAYPRVSQHPVVVPSGQPRASSALVPSGSLAPAHYGTSIPYVAPRRASRRGWLLVALIILVLVGLLVILYRPVLNLVFPPAATVTVTPASQLLKHTYPITAVLGEPAATQNQVSARALYANSQTQSQTVTSTGQGTIPGQQALGTLTFYNVSTSAQTVAANTVIIDSQGIAVVNDDALSLPAYNPLKDVVPVADTAHTIDEGSNQNIPAYTFNKVSCCGGTIYVSNTTAFVGGQDARNYRYVQQSDIDTAASSLETVLTRQATTNLSMQVRSNEQAASAARCQSLVNSDSPAGTQASTVRVSVTVNCMEEVYDAQGAAALAAKELRTDSGQSPGPAYLPAGDITTTVTQVTTNNGGDIQLQISAQGVWVYTFTNSQRVALAKLIAGKSKENARASLLVQPGVSNASIALSNATGEDTLPQSLSSITISIEAVQGLS